MLEGTLGLRDLENGKALKGTREEKSLTKAVLESTVIEQDVELGVREGVIELSLASDERRK